MNNVDFFAETLVRAFAEGNVCLERPVDFDLQSKEKRVRPYLSMKGRGENLTDRERL